IASMFIRGLLWVGHFSTASGDTHGVAGFFGQYDFAAAPLVRVSSTGFGIGLALQRRLSPNIFAQFTGLTSALPFVSAGLLQIDENLFRDYHIGPGGQMTLEVRLI